MYDHDYFFKEIAKGVLFLRVKDVTKITGMRRSVIEYLQKNNDFPKFVKLGSKTTAIRTDELWQWITTRERVEPKA